MATVVRGSLQQERGMPLSQMEYTNRSTPVNPGSGSYVMMTLSSSVRRITLPKSGPLVTAKLPLSTAPSGSATNKRISISTFFPTSVATVYMSS